MHLQGESLLNWFGTKELDLAKGLLCWWIEQIHGLPHFLGLIKLGHFVYEESYFGNSELHKQVCQKKRISKPFEPQAPSSEGVFVMSCLSILREHITVSADLQALDIVLSLA